MKYSLDTNACIRFINGRAPKLREKIATTPPNDIVVCSIVRGELAYGAEKSQNPETSHTKQARFLQPFDTLSFDDAAAQEFGRIRAHLERKGIPIGPYDMQIAAITAIHDLTLVTHNVKEFERISWLRIEDWE